MADEKDEEILLTVDIDEGAVEARLIELRKRSSELRAEKDLLRKANRDGTLSNEDYAKSLTKAQLSLNQTTKEIRENERVLEKNTQQQKAAAGSLNQMRAQVSLLYADFAALSKEERNNAEVGGVLQKRISGLNEELKKEEGAVGDNRRSVGSYAEAIEGAISKNTNFVSTLGAIRAKLGEAREAIGQQVQGYKDMTSGMGTTQKASVALGLGLKAIGIGLLIQAVTALIGFLSKMDAGMDKVEQATAAVEAAFEAFIQTISPIGELIVETFTHPLDSIAKFGNALLHPIDTLNNISTAGRAMAQNVSANMAKAARAAVEYTKAMQDSEDAQDALIGLQAKVNQQVSLALLATKDRSKTERERIKLLDDAGKAEQDLSNRVLKIRKDELAALVEFQKSKATLQDADRKKLEEVTAAATNAETENLETQQKVANRRSALIEAEVTERKAAAEKSKEIAKKAADERVAEAEGALIMAKRKGQETLTIEEEIIRRRLASEIIGLKKSSQQRLLFIAKANADILDLNAKHAAELLTIDSETTQNRINAQLALVSKGTQQELALQKKALEDRLQLDKSQAVEAAKLLPQTEANKRALNAKLRALDAKFNAENEQLDDAFAKGDLDRKADLDSKRLQTEIDLGAQTFAVQLANQRKQIGQEEKHALDILDLEERTAKERGLLDERLASELLIKRNAIQAKALAAQKQLDLEALARAKADGVALAEARLAGTAEGSKKELIARKALLKAQYEAEIANAKLTEAEKAKIKAQFQSAEKKLDDDFNKQTVQQIIETVSLATSVLSTSYEAQTQSLLANLDKQQAAALSSAGANADLRTKIEAEYQKKREKIEKEAAEKRRKIASIENLIATAQAGTAALTLFAKNPILGAITEALILAKAIQNQSLIDSQAFNQGGTYISDGRGTYVRGPGTGKSDSINSKLSNGESVLTAKATGMFYSQLSAMNVLGGGRAFPGAGGEPVPQLSNYSMGGVQSASDADAIAAAIITSMKGANFRVAVTDIHAVESDLIYAQAQGNV